MNDIMQTFVTDRKELRKPCRKLTPEDGPLTYTLWKKIHELWDTGWVKPLGVAANQVGYDVQYSIVKLDGGKKTLVLINSEIIEKRGMLAHDQEGCLSIPNLRFVTYRYQNITIKNTIPDDNFSEEILEFSGLDAQIVQHEIDHFNGILCSERTEKGFEDQPRNEKCACGSGIKFKKCHGA